MRSIRRVAATVALAAGSIAVSGTARAELQPGEPAPPLTIAQWLNVPKGGGPTTDSLKGKVVMVEFWGTWCGPCVRAMPRVQQIWDRYRDRGLVVLAVSYETPEVMRPFLEQNSYTMPVGSDPSKEFIGKFGFSGWPSTFVIDGEWKIAYAGSPYGAEPAVEKALGLEASPGSLLSGYLAALGGKDPANVRAALERLVEKAPHDFDLRAWAASAGGKPPGDGKEPPAVDGEKALARAAEAAAAGKEERRLATLDELSAGGPAKFDLAAWARALFGRDYPVTGAEMKALLEAGRYQDALDALLDRRPPGPVAAAAAKHDGLRDWCRKKADETRAFGRKGLMALLWPLAGKQPKNNSAFWNDLATSGGSFTEDKQRMTGVLIGGEMVLESAASAWVDRQLCRAILMKSVGSSGKTDFAGVRREAAKERESMTRELRTLYE